MTVLWRRALVCLALLPFAAVASHAESARASSVSREAIARGVRRNVRAIRVCYERALIRDPSAAGTVTVQFVIGRDGPVLSASISATTIQDTEMLDCLVSHARRWRFPPNPEGDVTVRFPFVFAPSS